MISKPLYFLSDTTLISILCEQKDIHPRIDPTSFGLFVETEHSKIQKVRRTYRVVLFGLFVLFFLSLDSLWKGFLDEGLGGLGIALSFIGFLCVHYFLFPKEKREIRKKDEYEETFLTIIKKDEIVKKATPEQAFHALMQRTQMILSCESLEERDVRLKTIILSINQAEEDSGKVFKINTHLKGNLGLLKDFFKEESNKYWLEEFISHHSIQINIGIEEVVA